jgi:rod shape-determining protein MreC
MGLTSSPFAGAELINAQIIGLSPQEEHRVVIVNVGQMSGVRYGMPVLTGAGVVGKIIGSENSRTVPLTSATVLLLIDPRCKIDAFIYRFVQPTQESPDGPPRDLKCPWNPVNWQQTRIRGVVEGAQNKLILKYVPRDADVKQGDRVVSSGLGGIFPKGLLIGTVSQVVPPKIGISPYIEVKPAVDFDMLEEVQVMIQKGAPAP